MKYVKTFEQLHSYNIDYSDVEPEYLEEYKTQTVQFPFNLLKSEACIDYDHFVLCFSNQIYYDYITDDLISKYINTDLSDVNLEKGWQNSLGEYRHAHDISLNDYHAMRIAKLAQEIKNGTPIKPISLWFDERAYMHDAPNFIEDGNHRIRAFQYLKYATFPAFIHGSHAEKLIELIKSL